MKVLRRVLVWSLIVFFIESGAFWYLDKFYSTTTKVYKEVKVDTKKPVKIVETKLPSTASNMSTSYDGRFVSFYDGGTLKIADTKTASINSVKPDDGNTIVFCQWITYDNILIMAEKTKNQGQNYFVFYSYFPAKNEKEKLIDFNNKVLQIALTSDKAQVSKLALSTKTHTMYIKVQADGNRSNIYRVNVMNEIEKLSINNNFIANIGVLPLTDNFVYEDTVYKRIRVLDSPVVIDTKSIKDPCLLGTDENDKIYIGDKSGGKITRVLFGSIEESFNKWTEVKLSDVQANDVVVTLAGKIYINDALNGYIQDAQTGARTKYQGILLGIYDGTAVSQENYTIKKVELK